MGSSLSLDTPSRMLSLLLCSLLIHPANAAEIDSDGDAMPDDWEVSNSLNPNDPSDAAADFDEDGLSSLQEYYSGSDPNDKDSDDDWLRDGAEVYTWNTSPVNADTDGDRMSDTHELFGGLNPLDSSDAFEDLDGDGAANYYEIFFGTRSNDATSKPQYMTQPLESFEAPGLPQHWTSPTANNVTWTTTCQSFLAFEGNCSLRAAAGLDAGYTSRVDYTVFVQASTLSFRTAYYTGGTFTVYLDGDAVYSGSGFNLWDEVEIELDEGGHEVSFEHDNESSASAILVLDALTARRG
jgi:hypothetical protein